jgi:serine/threonine-protein kinase
MFSPDGRWLAYASLESGHPEVYVRPFPGPGGKWLIGAGANPTWSRTKPELFYGAGGQIMVAGFTAEGTSFRAEKSVPWSERRYQTRGTVRMFDLHPDGERIALAPAAQAPAGAKADRLVFVFNFLEELSRLAPASR